jgi:GAF domain-containing protein
VANKPLDQQIEHIAAQALVGKLDRAAALQAGLVVIQQHFQCSRVSMWVFHGEPGASVMRCAGGYTALGEHLPPGAELRQDQYSAYFQEIFSAGAYVCHDTALDERLDGMRDSYLRPLRVTALLDAVFAYNGRAQGLLCCEQVDSPRHWTTSELADLKRCASSITRHANRWARLQSGAGLGST